MIKYDRRRLEFQTIFKFSTFETVAFLDEIIITFFLYTATLEQVTRSAPSREPNDLSVVVRSNGS